MWWLDEGRMDAPGFPKRGNPQGNVDTRLPNRLVYSLIYLGELLAQGVSGIIGRIRSIN